MNRTAPARVGAARATSHPTGRVLVGLAVLLTVVIGTVGHQSLTATAGTIGELLGSDDHGPLGEADGLLPDGASLFDHTPAVSNLDPALLAALRRAARDAAAAGVGFEVNSGWRSSAYQEWLLEEAVEEHGSAEEAARWVATARTSAHVAGDAVDLGPSDAVAWLSRHGAGYGLCQIYRNERWHYELRPAAPERGCPPMYADPTQDPRTTQ